MTICEKPFYKTRSQVLLMLYFALSQRPGSTRQDTVDHIQSEGWFAHEPEDFKPYPFAGTNEECWRILVAFARKDAFDHKPDRHMFEGHNRWELTRQGVEEFERVICHFRQGKGDVAKGYLWTPAFKKLLDPRYAQTSADAKRPGTIYRGLEASIMRARIKWLLDTI